MTDPDPLVLPGPGMAGRDEPGRRAAYRAWVREHHPDRGGDPTAFAQGLQLWRRTLRQPAVDDSAPYDSAPDGSTPEDRAADDGAHPAGPLTFHRTRRSSPLTWWKARRAERARPARVR